MQCIRNMLRAFSIGLLTASLMSGAAHAQASGPSAADIEADAANQAAKAAIQEGPRDITLVDQAVLKLPAGYGFIPKAEAARLMHSIGNHTDERFIGLIVSDKLEGFVSVDFEKAGYIKDDDAKDWNADDLLKNLKEGTAEGNKDRLARGMHELEVVGWVEKPGYEAATHRLVWSIEARSKGQTGDSGINYNTYVLGREGYLTLNLVTSMGVINNEKPMARELLAAVSFNNGKRYEDFNASTDHVAEYGLAALVGGLAVKKLGLLAVIGAFILKAWKLVALAVVGVGAGIKKFFGNKDSA